MLENVLKDCVNRLWRSDTYVENQSVRLSKYLPCSHKAKHREEGLA